MAGGAGVILWQKAEGAAICAVGLWLYAGAESVLSLWAAILVFFAPDLSFVAYALGRRVGAFCYNLVHVYAFGALALAIGHLLQMPIWWEVGALLLAHSGFDRMLGYGLKTTEGFTVTHLGPIGTSRTG
ncbi:DUF4260 domain-containing protein [Tritonibacter horizontis]|uniref:DUF4260 domain-containing protein n=1 Tax=Tritonibacter horizontis TaxID=1768241 RepID=A0A132C2Z7_9RHOB|nr:DUF4260 domain-containing protein [Tritonibacter horizontis]KUP94477.1 hypothetical protein TRIHO_06360 [Tritonibacter horizontis]